MTTQIRVSDIGHLSIRLAHLEATTHKLEECTYAIQQAKETLHTKREELTKLQAQKASFIDYLQKAQQQQSELALRSSQKARELYNHASVLVENIQQRINALGIDALTRNIQSLELELPYMLMQQEDLATSNRLAQVELNIGTIQQTITRIKQSYSLNDGNASLFKRLEEISQEVDTREKSIRPPSIHDNRYLSNLVKEVRAIKTEFTQSAKQKAREEQDLQAKNKHDELRIQFDQARTLPDLRKRAQALQRVELEIKRVMQDFVVIKKQAIPEYFKTLREEIRTAKQKIVADDEAPTITDKISSLPQIDKINPTYSRREKITRTKLPPTHSRVKQWYDVYSEGGPADDALKEAAPAAAPSKSKKVHFAQNVSIREIHYSAQE